ncbi:MULTISPECIES: hypothetical protein [unclassified Bacillus (in: firmicutes)]|uniref:DUF7010 family protein n=1 Tax=unclassified Bacillus (in: firmicutes) TaxID=185979 RepID=UPI0008EF0D9F|nr:MULTISPECIES: hypothetical protein [unclassified Bacillus (in: firmicutes)]SFB04490.1 hypothetical protein SAMN02799634_104303 [Bacillus sp. UNCCL13]SFQ88499.1 hypothetical protein SAMN04488577_3211 [Bacillus sp. cl95]
MGNDGLKSKFADLQQDLSSEAQNGYPMFIAGIVFWLCAGLASFFLAEKVLVWVYVFGVGLVFPLGILVSKVLKINFLATHNPLSVIGGLVGGIQIFFAPLVILVAYEQPGSMPFVVGVLTGAHFLPYVAIYQSKAYLFQTVGTVLAVSVIGINWMDQAFTLIPFVLVVVYAITLIWLIREVSVKKSHAARNLSI